MGKKLTYLFLLLFTILGFQPLVAQTENAIRTGQNSEAQPATIQYLYEEALAEIKAMLEGKQKASFKKAVFLTENAFLEGQVPYPAFEQIIQEATKICEYIESIDSLIYTHKDRDEVRKNAAIFRYMTQALVLEDSLLTLPYRYDFEDFMGKDDWTKTFVSKLLVTHQGNCHSLPYLYKILADEMGAKAWLSLAPNHIYIKNQSQKISWYNTELTSATFPIDAWLMASGYITYESVVNRVYMDTLGVKQSLALCLVDLAQGYQRKQANYNPDFALKCVDLALQYYPQYINALLLKADILRQRSINQAHQDLKTTEELIKICDKIYDLGYREMPASMYLEWLSGDKYKAPDSVRTQNTQKGNPFIELGYKKEVLTLSNGRYDEFQQKERLVKIGWVMYDTEKKVISEYLSPNPQKVQIAPELVSRFLSVDPIGREYPFLSPYQFAGNMPSVAIDLDGLEPFGTGWTPEFWKGQQVYVSPEHSLDGKAGAFYSNGTSWTRIKEAKNSYQYIPTSPTPTQSSETIKRDDRFNMVDSGDLVYYPYAKFIGDVTVLAIPNAVLTYSTGNNIHGDGATMIDYSINWLDLMPGGKGARVSGELGMAIFTGFFKLLKSAAPDLKMLKTTSLVPTEIITGGEYNFARILHGMENSKVDTWATDPIKVIVIDGKQVVVDGHHRLAIAQQFGIDELPVEILNEANLQLKTYQTINQVRTSLQRTAGKSNQIDWNQVQKYLDTVDEF
jgi:hypothetical protein